MFNFLRIGSLSNIPFTKQQDKCAIIKQVLRLIQKLNYNLLIIFKP